MPLRIRFTGAATPNSTLTVQWQGGYPPSGTSSAVQTFKSPIRTTNFQTTVGTSALNQAEYYYAAMSSDFSVNFTITRINNDVIINPKNGSNIISGTTSSANVLFNPVVQAIEMIGQPQYFIPIYNPVTYRFFSNNYSRSGYNYTISVVKNNNVNGVGLTLSQQRVKPDIDGTGYIDISKVVSNFTSVNFNPTASYLNNADKSYNDFSVYIGEEFTSPWLFSTIASDTTVSSDLTSANNFGRIKLIQIPNLETHNYATGSQINISTPILTGSQSIVNGLHTVTGVPNGYTVIIGVNNPIGVTVSTSGITTFADGRKTSYSNLVTVNNVGFNGAIDFLELPLYKSPNYLINPGNTSSYVKLLTSLKSNDLYTSDIHPDESKFYATYEQEMWINMGTISPTHSYEVDVVDSNNNLTAFTISDGTGIEGIVKQFKVGGKHFNLPTSIDWFQFRIRDITSSYRTTNYYRIYLYKKCKIENYEIAFMDEMGSILSYSFPLRAYEKGNIKRDISKQAVIYNEGSTDYSNIYKTYDSGSIITSVNVDRQIELNTDWMTDFMSVLFDDMLASPYTWLRITPESYEGVLGTSSYVSCSVVETDFKVEKQKNKRLIRKTVSVKLSNENIKNI